MIGVIGFGRFGELAVRYLSRRFPVRVLERGGKGAAIRLAGGTPAPLEGVCRQSVLILAVPISAMRGTLAEIAPRLSPGTLVVDVCSVKVLPVAWMQAALPAGVRILATHPMFGPDSAARRLEGQKIVLCPVRISPGRLRRIRELLEAEGLRVIEATPDEHDRQIATSLALTHFIGRALAAFGAPELTIDTEGYRRLLTTLAVVENDTWQLFEDMHRFNPYAREARQAFVQALEGVNRRLEAHGVLAGSDSDGVTPHSRGG